MLKKTIKYTDYNGVEREEDFYFHLTKADIAKMEMGVKGGLAQMIRNIVNAKDQPAIIAVFEDLIQKSYGVKTPDGRGFDKDPKHLKEFMMTEAYSQLFMELGTDDEAAAKFINGIIPADMAKELAAATANNI